MKVVLCKVRKLPYRRFISERAEVVGDRFYYDGDVAFQLLAPLTRFRESLDKVAFRHFIKTRGKIFRKRLRYKKVWWDSVRYKQVSYRVNVTKREQIGVNKEVW